MNLAVIKNHNTSSLAACRELGESTGPLLEGEELMSVEAYNAWLQEPEQVAAMNAIKEAEEAEVLSKLIAKDEAAISEFMGIWECTRPQAIYELTWRNVLQIVKE